MKTNSWAARGLTIPLGELLSDTLEPVVRTRDVVWEAQSTEEVLRKISEVNIKLKDRRIREIMVGSLDVEALDQKEGPKILANEVLRSKVQFENVNEEDINVSRCYSNL